MSDWVPGRELGTSVTVARQMFQIINDNDNDGHTAHMEFSHPMSEEEVDDWVHRHCPYNNDVCTRDLHFSSNCMTIS